MIATARNYNVSNTDSYVFDISRTENIIWSVITGVGLTVDYEWSMFNDPSSAQWFPASSNSVIDPNSNIALEETQYGKFIRFRMSGSDNAKGSVGMSFVGVVPNIYLKTLDTIASAGSTSTVMLSRGSNLTVNLRDYFALGIKDAPLHIEYTVSSTNTLSDDVVVESYPYLTIRSSSVIEGTTISLAMIGTTLTGNSIVRNQSILITS